MASKLTNSYILSTALALSFGCSLSAIASPLNTVEKVGGKIGGGIKGVASFYADKFVGRKTASGERFDNSKMTCAHRTLPFGTKLLVTNPDTGSSCVVVVNDRGPYKSGRVVDLSKAAARKLGITGLGKVVCYTGKQLEQAVSVHGHKTEIASSDGSGLKPSEVQNNIAARQTLVSADQ